MRASPAFSATSVRSVQRAFLIRAGITNDQYSTALTVTCAFSSGERR